MSVKNGALWGSVVAALETIRPRLGEDMYGRLYDILWQNGQSGRIKTVFRNEVQLTAEQYVSRVEKFYLEEHEQVDALRYQANDEAWQAIYAVILRAARRFVSGKGFHAAELQAKAEANAQNAAVAILKSHYTCDTSFKAWVTAVTKNISRNAARSSKTIDSQAVEYGQQFDSQTVDVYHAVDSAEAAAEKADMIGQLADALFGLKAEQIELLNDRFFNDLSKSACAKARGVTPSTILRQEQKILQYLRGKLEQNF